MPYYVYILCSQKNGTLYIGVTHNITRRTYEHKNKLIQGFTSKYHVVQLVYLEGFIFIEEAVQHEKCLKKWNRSWKLRLIEEQNPRWKDQCRK